MLRQWSWSHHDVELNEFLWSHSKRRVHMNAQPGFLNAMICTPKSHRVVCSPHCSKSMYIWNCCLFGCVDAALDVALDL